VINFLSSKKGFFSLSWIIIISSTIFSIGGLFYFFYILEYSLSKRITILSQHPVNVISVIAGSSILFALNQLCVEKHIYRKAALIFCLFPLSGLIIAGQARSAFIGIILAIMLFFGNSRKRVIILMGISLAVLAMTYNENRLMALKLRLDISKNINYITYEIIKEHPIIGIGFGLQTYGELDLKKYNKRLPKEIQANEIIGDPHNIILDVTVRTGVVGLAFFVYIIFTFFKLCWSCASNGKDDFIKSGARCFAGVFIVLFATGLFHPIFSHVPEVLFCIVFSGITVLWRLNHDVGPITTS